MDSIPCTILNGKPVFNQTSLYLFGQKNEGKYCDLVLRKRRRTLSQNSYVHVLFGYLADETGQDKEEIKTIEKRRHLTPHEVEFMGQKQMVLPSLAKMENVEMSEFIDKVLADCAFLGIEVPSRESLGYLPG